MWQSTSPWELVDLAHRLYSWQEMQSPYVGRGASLRGSHYRTQHAKHDCPRSAICPVGIHTLLFVQKTRPAITCHRNSCKQHVSWYHQETVADGPPQDTILTPKSLLIDTKFSKALSTNELYDLIDPQQKVIMAEYRRHHSYLDKPAHVSTQTQIDLASSQLRLEPVSMSMVLSLIDESPCWLSHREGKYHLCPQLLLCGEPKWVVSRWILDLRIPKGFHVQCAPCVLSAIL